MRQADLRIRSDNFPENARMRKRRESLPEIGNQMNAKIGKVDDDQQNRLTLRLTEEATTWAASRRKEWHRPNQQRVTVVIIKRSRRFCGKSGLREHHRERCTVSLERDFCRWRLARQEGPEDEISARRSEIGDHHAREMAAKAAFLLACVNIRVSEDCVVETRWIETGCPPRSHRKQSPTGIASK